MALSDKTIKSGKLVMKVSDERQYQPGSVDLRVGNTFARIPKYGTVRLGEPIEYETVLVDDGGVYSMKPGEFVLATTKERISIPNNVIGFVEGRSSIGRIGLFCENAGLIDPGFDGHITMELYNPTTNIIEIPVGYRIGQVWFDDLDEETDPYHGKYTGQVEATGSRMQNDDF